MRSYPLQAAGELLLPAAWMMLYAFSRAVYTLLQESYKLLVTSF